MSKKDDILRSLTDEVAEINFDNLKKRDLPSKKHPFSEPITRNHALS